MQQRIPLVYFHGLVPGRYLAIWPVYIVGDDPQQLTFTVAVDDTSLLEQKSAVTKVAEPIEQARRSYITTTVRQRIHQQSFRERVLRRIGSNALYVA
jgi:putative restriction endonuclease